jgi:Methylene-tetrahydrofolate reductase C terminal
VRRDNGLTGKLVAVVVAIRCVNAQDSHHGVPYGPGQPAVIYYFLPGKFWSFAICLSGIFIPPGTVGRVTARPPMPAHPHLGVRVAYRLQRVLRPNAGLRWLSARIEASGPARAAFTGAEQLVKEPLFGCRMCGQCALPVTGYVCPMGCPKELRNGPCGGVGPDGTCEVYPELRCVWVDAYERAASAGRAADLRLLHRPADNRRWGQSSWLNYWQGRDAGLWTGEAAETAETGETASVTGAQR